MRISYIIIVVNPYMFRSHFVVIFREVFFEGYIKKTSQPMYNYKILIFKYVMHNMC